MKTPRTAEEKKDEIKDRIEAEIADEQARTDNKNPWQACFQTHIAHIDMRLFILARTPGVVVPESIREKLRILERRKEEAVREIGPAVELSTEAKESLIAELVEVYYELQQIQTQ